MRAVVWLAFAIVRRAIQEFGEDQGPTLAPAIAYFALFSIFPLLLGLSFGIFFGIYKLLPHTTVRTRPAVAGGVFAAILFERANRGFVLYVREFAGFNLVYGSLASVIVLLFWFYLVASILLLGAEFGKAFAVHTGVRPVAPGGAGTDIAVVPPLTREER